jgi:hypothetical protein
VTRRQAGLILTAAHLALVGAIGLKLLIDRARLPRGWALTAPFDPSTPLRGRYVRLSLEIPLTSPDTGTGSYRLSGVRLRSVDGKVVGELDETVRAPRVQLRDDAGERSVRLAEPVAFFIPEHVPDPSSRPSGEQLWVEVTLPAAARPRPIRLGVLKQGSLTPLDLR